MPWSGRGMARLVCIPTSLAPRHSGRAFASVMSTRKRIIATVLVASLPCLYVLASFASVERVKKLPKIEIVNRSSSAVPDPRSGVEVMTESYAAIYSFFPAEVFTPAHYLDSRFLRPAFWSEKRTETPVAPRS